MMEFKEKSYWQDRSLWDKKITIEIPLACLQEDYEEPEYKLAHLLAKEVVFTNNGWWFKEENKPWQEDYTTLHVNCNDVFAWGAADAENITFSEISELYEIWKKDEVWGPAIWCVKKRKMIPQDPVVKLIKDAGIWDLDEILKLAGKS
jgi:hypothetical protein